MKKIRATLSRVLVLTLILLCIPVNVFGASYPVLEAEEEDGFISFYPVTGNNYSISGVVGEEASIFLEYPEGYNEGYVPIAASAVSSKPSVVEADIYVADIPDLEFKKAGSATVTIKDKEGKKTVLKVTVTKAKVETANYIMKNSTKVTVKAKNVKKGDIIKLKIGKKTYSKTVKKTKKSASFKFNIKKPGFSGKKFTLTLNRKGKAVATYKDYVYRNEKPGNTKASSIEYTGTNDTYSIESFEWNKASRAEGYQVRFISADSYDYDDLIVTYGRGTTDTNSISLKTPDLDTGEYFRVQVRAFRTKKGGTKVYGDWITSTKKFAAFKVLY